MKRLSAALSMKLVGSSSTRIGGSSSSARAIAIACRWPPESASPRSPTTHVVAQRMRAPRTRRPRRARAARSTAVVVGMGRGRARCSRAACPGTGTGPAARSRCCAAGRRGRSGAARCRRPARRPVRLVEPEQQLLDRGLAGADPADQADPLAGGDPERDVGQRRQVLARVGERDVLELDRALELRPVQEAAVRRPLDRQGHHRVQPVERGARLMVAVEHAGDLGQRRHGAAGQDAAGDQGAGRQRGRRAIW